MSINPMQVVSINSPGYDTGYGHQFDAGYEHQSAKPQLSALVHSLHRDIEPARRMIKSSFSIALICTTSRRVPANAGTNQETEKGDLVPRDRACELPPAISTQSGYDESTQVISINPPNRNKQPWSTSCTERSNLHQIVVFNRPDLYHKSPGSCECRYK